jgi:hypothetical protein
MLKKLNYWFLLNLVKGDPQFLYMMNLSCDGDLFCFR